MIDHTPKTMTVFMEAISKYFELLFWLLHIFDIYTEEQPGSYILLVSFEFTDIVIRVWFM
jgi:hypothetical protein